MPEAVTALWRAAFTDPQGGFHERLDKHLKSENLPKRLLTQCRQLFVYGSEGMDVEREWQYVVDTYRVPETGGWRFSQIDDRYDLYVHAFVLLTCATLKKFDIARQTLAFIDTHFRIDGRAGFVSTLNAQLVPQPGPLYQNPHMHLFESLTAMAAVSDDPVYGQRAEELLNVILDHFYDGVIREYHDGENAHIIEGGHQSEWIWLLTHYRNVLKKDDARIDPMMASLFDWVHAHGVDKTHGGILNAQTRDGVILDDKKRIWPVCETLRAAHIMGDQKLADDMRAMLKGNYLRTDGFWNEMLDKNLTVVTDYLPGTTVYHLYQILDLV